MYRYLVISAVMSIAFYTRTQVEPATDHVVSVIPPLTNVTLTTGQPTNNTALPTVAASPALTASGSSAPVAIEKIVSPDTTALQGSTPSAGVQTGAVNTSTPVTPIAPVGLNSPNTAPVLTSTGITSPNVLGQNPLATAPSSGVNARAANPITPTAAPAQPVTANPLINTGAQATQTVITNQPNTPLANATLKSAGQQVEKIIITPVSPRRIARQPQAPAPVQENFTTVGPQL